MRSRGTARRIWPVRELVAQVRELVEQEYGDVWVEGEISNYRPAPSGHVYFTLKDADAQLPIVLFRRQAMLLRFRPEDGLHVLVRGRMSVYEQRGQMQLVAETMEPVGAGSLQLAFEQLKERLKAEGLFDADRKTPAAHVSPHRGHRHLAHRRRHSRFPQHRQPPPLRLECPALSRSPFRANPRRLKLKPRWPNSMPAALVDLIVLARGGGSLEDLAAFNTERVARAIASSRLPVVSAVGHETDFTIADFAADLRAPTPSAAAELITEAQHKIAEHLAAQSHRLERAARFQLLQSRQRLTRLPISRAESRVSTLLHRLGQRLDDATLRLDSALAAQLRLRQNRIAELAAAVLRSRPAPEPGPRARAPRRFSRPS